MIPVGLVIFQMSFQYSLFSSVLNDPFIYVHKIQTCQVFFLYLLLCFFNVLVCFSMLYKLKQKLMELEVLCVVSAVLPL